MAANEIIPFAQGPGSPLVLSQAAYVASTIRPVGHQPGIADPQLENKALRQLTAIAVGVAQFLADNQATDITDSLSGASLSTIITNAIKAVTIMPAGAIVWMPTSTAPTGTVKCNGALLSRVTYARLWTFANASGNIVSDATWTSTQAYGSFSTGDGSTTFRVPDLRGYSVRAWDDARGVDTSRAIGSSQASQLPSHTHTVTDPGHTHAPTVTNPTHTHTINISDPTHVHALSLSDPGHTHSISDLGHGHTISDPGHFHGVFHDTASSTAGSAISGASSTNTVSSSGTSTTGIAVNSGGTGIGIVPVVTSVSLNNAGAATNISAAAVAASPGVGVTLPTVTTGLTIANTGTGSEVRTPNIALMPVMYY